MARGIDPLSDRPVYKQIADTVRALIDSGELEPGARVPSEAQLVERFGVSQGTVRQALSLLRGQGLVVAEHGRGVFVRSKPAVDVFFVGPEKSDSVVAGLLGLRAGAKVLVRRRRYLADDVPTELATSYIPWSLAEGTQMTKADSGPGGVYARIEERGRKLGRFTEEVSARMPTVEESNALRLAAGTPVLTLVRVAYDSDDQPVEVCDTVMSADHYTLSYELPAD